MSRSGVLGYAIEFFFFLNSLAKITDVQTAAWREPYGQTGILDFFLHIIATEDLHDDVLLHSLRLVGNSCADTSMSRKVYLFRSIAYHPTDENRMRVVNQNYTLHIIKLFQNPAVLHVAIPVIYNVCVDFGKCSYS